MTDSTKDKKDSQPVNGEKKPLRSQQWYGKLDKDGFIHRSWMKNQGLPDHSFDGRPVIGICNSWSELTPCNAHLRELAEYVMQADEGADLDFLVGNSGSKVSRESH
ncbi:L-arabonate dehydratase [Marinomonas spartinae]|uniref:L-arabonate dehydratase n=1 Tax=Marinomonas spartinae TaxID=1792290 RepID=A0A1A8TC52_9GAMM|nr:L-arabonate dehydratase [Marinomonas spartinae]